MVLIIDNYDSFTYNIYQAAAALGYPAEVIRNDRISIHEISGKGYSAIIISPGPGRPDDAGASKTVIKHFAGKIPILGICLGHQAIAEAYGGKIVRAPAPVHGKTSDIYHDGTGLFRGLPRPFTAGRYHSLVVSREKLPDCLEIKATSQEGLIMGVKHRDYKVEGVQFHPESILTPEGKRLLNNFLTAAVPDTASL